MPITRVRVNECTLYDFNKEVISCRSWPFVVNHIILHAGCYQTSNGIGEARNECTYKYVSSLSSANVRTMLLKSEARNGHRFRLFTKILIRSGESPKSSPTKFQVSVIGVLDCKYAEIQHFSEIRRSSYILTDGRTKGQGHPNSGNNWKLTLT